MLTAAHHAPFSWTLLCSSTDENSVPLGPFIGTFCKDVTNTSNFFWKKMISTAASRRERMPDMFAPLTKVADGVFTISRYRYFEFKRNNDGRPPDVPQGSVLYIVTRPGRWTPTPVDQSMIIPRAFLLDSVMQFDRRELRSTWPLHWHLL